MNTRKNSLPTRTLLALSVMGAFGAAYAQERGDIGQPMSAEGSYVGVGIGMTGGDERERARFGMFNGLRERDANALLGFRYQQPWSASGTGLKIEGRNLGLDTRELNVVYRRPGDFKYSADYSEITRHDPRTINTSQQGFGTATPVVNPGGVLIAPGTGQNHDLKLERKAIGLGAEKWITNTLQLELAFRNEEKDGARHWGRGFNCAGTSGTQPIWTACGASSATGLLLLAEPVDSTIRQLDAKLNYASGPLVLSGGYYGSFYKNKFGSLAPTVNGPLSDRDGGLIAAGVPTTGLAAALSLPLALWPDNQAHTLSLAGNYALTPKTRVNFKYAYTRATQDESFSGMGLELPVSGRGNLGGEINTTRAQLGISAHPIHKLHVSGDLSYMHKQNKTPLDYYNVNTSAGATAASLPVTREWTNGNMSPTVIEGKVQASYQLTPNYTGVLGAFVEDEDFGTWTPTEVPGGITAAKQKLRETGWRAELRRVMSERFTGSVAYENARRKGKSSWLKPQNLSTQPPATFGLFGVFDASGDCATQATGQPVNACVWNRTGIIPFIYMDREHDKVRFTGNWTATEKLELQVFADRRIERYHGPTEHGLRSTQGGNLALDATYALSEAWKLSAFASRGKQTTDAGHSSGYDAILEDTATSVGFGVKGRPMGRLQVGADFMWVNDVLRYDQAADPTSAANQVLLNQTGGLPDVKYSLTRLNLYGEYALLKNSSVRLDYIHHRTFFNEWTYNYNGVPFLFSDNTSVDAQQRQTVDFVGVTYIHKF